MTIKRTWKTGLFTLALAVVTAAWMGCGSGERQNDSGAGKTAKPPPTVGSQENRVLSLNGKTAYMRVPDSPSFHTLTNAITLEFWFKASSFYGQPGAVNSVLRKNVEAGRQNFFLRFRTVSGKPAIEFTAGSRMGILHSPCEIKPDEWYHLAGSYDGSVMKAFANGVEVMRANFPGPMVIDESDLFIGKGDPEYSFGEFFHGAVDELRIWKVARSPEQIRAAMNARLTGKKPGLVAYWNFEDNTGKDSSGHGNDGDLGGEARIVTEALPTEVVAPEPKPRQTN